MASARRNRARGTFSKYTPSGSSGDLFVKFYRAKEDGMSVLGLREPWEHGGSHGSTVNTDNVKFKVTGIGEIPVLDTEDDHHH